MQLKKYFDDPPGFENDFYPPASDDQIAGVERSLGIILPHDYCEFLKFSNGFDGCINDFFATFCSVEKIEEETGWNKESFPWAICIGGNGGGELFVIDTRAQPYQFGLLPSIGDDNDFIPLGHHFEEFIKRLHDDTAFDKENSDL